MDKQNLLLDNRQLLIFDDLDVKQLRRKKTRAEKQRTRENPNVNLSIITTSVSVFWPPSISRSASIFPSAGYSTALYIGASLSADVFLSADLSPSINASAS